MPDLPFLNTNIVLRHLTQDHRDLSPRATALMRRIARGELAVRTADTVIFETAYTLQRFYRIPREDIRGALMDLLALPGIRLANKRRYARVFDLYVSLRALSFADCFHVALMETTGLTELLSFDRDIDRVPTITRKEPDATGALL
jgi:predicted nucleic acid-binding protein